MTLKAAWMMDTVGNKAARAEIAIVKVIVPSMAGAVIDRAIQVHGGAGLSQDFFLAEAFAETRFLRIGDGPDEVHREALARIEAGARRALNVEAFRCGSPTMNDFVMRPEDEMTHRPDTSINFNESVYTNGFDTASPVGGWMRLGNRINESYAELSVCLYLPDGRIAC